MLGISLQTSHALQVIGCQNWTIFMAKVEISLVLLANVGTELMTGQLRCQRSVFASPFKVCQNIVENLDNSTTYLPRRQFKIVLQTFQKCDNFIRRDSSLPKAGGTNATKLDCLLTTHASLSLSVCLGTTIHLSPSLSLSLSLPHTRKVADNRNKIK